MPASAAAAAPCLVLTATTDLVHDQRLQRTAASLARAGYRVLLVGWQRPASAPLPTQPFAQHRLRGWCQRGKLFYLEYNLRLLCFLFFQRADLWVSADLDAALPTWLRARLGGQPFGYDAHELFSEVPEVVGRPAVRRFWRAVENFIVPRAQLRYTVGPALARLFEQRHPGYPFAVVRNVPVAARVGGWEGRSLRVGYWGARLKRRDNNLKVAELELVKSPRFPSPSPQYLTPKLLPSYPPTLIYQGALNVGRGLPELLAVLPELPGLRLVLCGEGDLSATLRAQAARLGLLASGQVEFRGFVRPADLGQLTAQATLGINLLEDRGLSYYFSLANKFFDYVQAGIPQLCTDFPEYRALNAQHEVAHLVPDLRPATLLAALRALLPQGLPGAHYQHLAAACAMARRTWTWQCEEPTLLALYQRVLPLGATREARNLRNTVSAS